MTDVDFDFSTLMNVVTPLGNPSPESDLTDDTNCQCKDRHLPVLAEAPSATNITEITNCNITNDEFLAAVFHTLSGDQKPITCGFEGHPKDVDPRGWSGNPWIIGITIFLLCFNNYFSLASFNPDAGGYWRRRKENFSALHAIMLDDIGTKAAGLDRLNLPPSWRLETSPGNFQVGYIFSAPVTDVLAAEKLMKAIIAAGLCDPGASGPLTRYARLPVGVNGKHDPPFSCRLVDLNPDLRYTLEQIIDGLQLDYSTETSKLPVKRSPGSKRVASNMDDLHVVRAAENPVITAFKAQGLYVKPLGDGKHEIICPWQHEHTGGTGGGTAYWEPSASFPLGGFKCQHGHCAGRHIRDLLEHLGISKTVAKHRPIIRMVAGELYQIVDLCERELAQASNYYQRGGLLVIVITDPGTGETSIKNLSMSSLVRALSEIVCFEKYDNRTSDWFACDPSERYCRILFEGERYPYMPILNGIARQPYLRPNGSLMMDSGYDPATKMYGVFDKADFRVPDHPTKLDAENALKVIDELLVEFSFRDEHDHAAAIAAILTAAIRPSLPLAPMFHICAPQIASGKSYLATLIGAFATPLSMPSTSFPRNEEECGKLLLSVLMLAPAVICFDNLTSDLAAFKSLCSALTEALITGRILGLSKMVTVSTCTLMLSSGNNVNPVRDMTRRTITINLDPRCETPATRTFNNQPVELVKANRGYFVSLALTIVRAFIVAGRPYTEIKPLASYTDWSGLCRQSLLWLGQPDPAISVFEGMLQDPDRETLGLLLRAWNDCFGDRPKMLREAITNASNELKEVLSDIAGERGEINRKKLGRWIARHAGRLVDGLRFEKDSSTRSAVAWRSKKVSLVSKVSTPPQTNNMEDLFRILNV